MEYQKTVLSTALNVTGIYSVHYFEYAKDFAYSGEIHDFWELVYADKQSIIVTAGAKEVLLPMGHMYLHRPNEFHNIRCDGVKAANSIIISFDCQSAELMNIAGIKIACDAEQRALLGAIVSEAREVFSTPLGLSYTRHMQKSGAGAFGCEQLLGMYLEQLLISLIRGNRRSQKALKPLHNKLLISVCEYLEKNVEQALRFSDIQQHFNVSASVLKKAFREHMGCGVMEHFNRLKIDAAKELIRESGLNFTEIADRLAFNNSQYFTTVFRRISSMTPSEYATSVRSDR